MQVKTVSIFGSTGSIGKQALEYLKDKEDFKVLILVCKSNKQLLIKQALDFKVKYVALTNNFFTENEREYLKKNNISIVEKENALELTKIKVSISLLAITGTDCIEYLISSIRAKNDIALANKEALITLGKKILDEAEKNNVNIYPVDSEHSSIWKLLDFDRKKKVENIIITASGGSLFDKDLSKTKNIKVKDVLNHPTWNMGNKITVDSATMMNKGFEILEATILFNKDLKNVNAIIQRESLIHAMVEENNEVKADISYPNMILPISIALEFPNKTRFINKKVEFEKIKNLTFYEIKEDKFPLYFLFRNAIKDRKLNPSKLCFANDILVERFLREEITYFDLIKKLEQIYLKDFKIEEETIENIFYLKEEVRRYLGD